MNEITAAQAADIKAVRESDRGQGALVRTISSVLAYPFKAVPDFTAEVVVRLDALVAEGHLVKTGSRYSVNRGL